MLTWQIPYTGYLSLQVTFHHTTDDFRPDIPDDSDLPWLSRVGPHSKVNLDPFKSLMVECWHQDPEQRPSFSEVAARLSALMHWQSTVGRIRAQLAAAATNAASASSSGVINQGKGSLPSISSQVHSSSSSMLSSAVNQPVPPPRSSHKDNSETSTVQIASHQGELNPDPYASLEASESKAELTGPFGNAFASAIAATEFGLRDGSAAGDSEGGLSANFSLSSSVISGPFGGAFGNASLALTSAIDSTNAGGPLSWVSYPPTNAHGAHSSIPLLLPSKESGGSHLPINNGPEMQLPAMPMPGEPTTLLTPEAAAWLNSIMASKKLQQQQKKQALAPSWPKTPTRVAAAAAGAATDGGSSQPCPPSQTKALLQRPSVGEEAPDPLSFFQPPPQLKTIASSTRKGSVDEGQSSVIPGSPIIVPVDGF